MTLGGLAKHLALVEDHYFTHLLLGRPYPEVWAPLADDPDWDWHSATDDSPEEIRALWEAAVARSTQPRRTRVLPIVRPASMSAMARGACSRPS